MSMYGLNYIVLKIKKSKLGELIAMAISYELNISNIPQSFDQNQMSSAKDNLIKSPLLYPDLNLVDLNLVPFAYFDFVDNALIEFNKTFFPLEVLDYGLPENTPKEALESYAKESDDAYSLYIPWSSRVPVWNEKSNDYNGEDHLEEMYKIAYSWYSYFREYMPDLVLPNKEEIMIAGDALSQTQPFEKRKLTIID